MKIIQKKKQTNQKTIGAVVTGVAEAVTIAGVTFAAMALKDKKTREKVKKTLIGAKDQAMDYLETLKTDLNAKEETQIVKKDVVKSK
jgi:hypothetical protein